MRCLGLMGASVGTVMGSVALAVATSAPAASNPPNCSASAQARAAAELGDAEGLAAGETRGYVAKRQLSRVARDTTLLDALRAGRLNAARAEAARIVFVHRLPDGTLINHIVRLRFTTGSRILIDTNRLNFAVDGPSVRLRRHDGGRLGALKISIQDVLGYVKYVHDLFGFDLVARGREGTLTSLRAVPRHALPAAGCVRIAAVSYAVRSFAELSFSGEPLTVWVLARH